MGILAAVLLFGGIAVRPDADPFTAQDALWSVGAEDGADAPAGKGLPSEILPDDLLTARWAVRAGVADHEQTLALQEAPARRSPKPRRDALADDVDRIADADTLPQAE